MYLFPLIVVQRKSQTNSSEQISECSGSCSTDESLHCSESVVKHNETPRDGHIEKVVISTKVYCLILIFNMYDFL